VLNLSKNAMMISWTSLIRLWTTTGPRSKKRSMRPRRRPKMPRLTRKVRRMKPKPPQKQVIPKLKRANESDQKFFFQKIIKMMFFKEYLWNYYFRKLLYFVKKIFFIFLNKLLIHMLKSTIFSKNMSDLIESVLLRLNWWFSRISWVWEFIPFRISGNLS